MCRIYVYVYVYIWQNESQNTKSFKHKWHMGQALNGFTQPLSECLFQILFQTSEGRVVNLAKAPMFGALETVLEEKQNQTNKR